MKNSIVAGKIASDLVKELNKGADIAHAHHASGKYEIWLYARHCTIKSRRSGGLVIGGRASAPAYSYSSVPFRAEKRLKPGWTARSLYRHAADLAETLRQLRCDPLVQMREYVYKVSETKKINPDAVPDSIAEPFDTMSEETCRAALLWLEKQPLP